MTMESKGKSDREFADELAAASATLNVLLDQVRNDPDGETPFREIAAAKRAEDEVWKAWRAHFGSEGHLGTSGR